MSLEDMEIAPVRDVPELEPVQVGRILIGTLLEILQGLGITAKADIQLVEPELANKDALLKAVKRHTAALSYAVQKAGVTADYIQSRQQENENENG